jgi:hypothetical protein
MDKTSRLIYEAFEGGMPSGGDRFELEEFVRRPSTTTSTNFDHMEIRDTGSNKGYTLVQIIDKKNGDVVSTAIFDKNLPNDNGMIYHSISNDAVDNYVEFVKNFDDSLRTHPYYKDNNEGVYSVFHMLKKFKKYPEKERNILAHKIKPKTVEHFGDILESYDDQGFVKIGKLKLRRSLKKDLSGEYIDALGKESSYIADEDLIDIVQYSSPYNTIVAFQLIAVDNRTKEEFIEETSFYLRAAGNKLKYMTIIYGDFIMSEIRNNKGTYDQFFKGKPNLYKDFIAMGKLLDNLELNKRKLHLHMKPKTLKHFGDILG